MLLDNRPYTFDRVVRLALGLAICTGLILLLAYISDVLVPFAVAFLLAYLFNPVVSKLQDWGIRSRLAAVLLTLLLVTGVLGGAAWVITPMIGAQAKHLAEQIKNLKSPEQSLSSPAGTPSAQTAPGAATLPAVQTPQVPAAEPEVAQKVRDFLKGTQQKVHDYLKSSQLQEYLQSDEFLNLLKDAATKLVPIGKGLFSGVISTFLALAGLLVILLYTVFLMLDFQKVRKDWQNLIPADYRDTVVAFVQDFNDGMNRYFRAQATISCIVGTLYAIGFQIVGLPLGILLGMLIAVLGMVPYLRTLSIVPALMLVLIKSLEPGQSFWMVLLSVLIVYAVAEAIDGAFLTPRIMGDVTGLNPALIILSLSVWGKLLGFLGLLIALPATCLLLAYYRRLLATRPLPADTAPPPAALSPLADAGDHPPAVPPPPAKSD